GSFLNVCIYRIPLKKSLIRPGSSCTLCNKKIKWYDNIPVISFIFLNRKCRFCNKKITVRYPLIELMTAISYILLYKKFGITYDFFIYVAFFSILIVVSFIDFEHGIIPNIISIPSIPIFIALSLISERIDIVDSLTGSITGFSILFLIFAFYYLLTKKEGMGIGDVKLIALIGAAVGLKGILFTIFISSIVGTLYGFILMIFNRKGFKSSIPFGPFLSIGAIIYIMSGEEIIEWYLGIIL
ncbi:MAG: prepilin peptidase, partial [Desulfobacterales bacterium]|nr:prepilin peptidase [Desulfobacterales bacterium]